MKRLIIGAALALGVSWVVAGALAAESAKPYIGSWKARMTKVALIDQGFVDPRAVGTWKLVLSRDGTYKTFNPLDRWSSGEYASTGRRIVFKKDVGCQAGGFKQNGSYTWSIRSGKLTLESTSTGSDPCGGRWQTLTFPTWRRAQR